MTGREKQIQKGSVDKYLGQGIRDRTVVTSNFERNFHSVQEALVRYKGVKGRMGK